jgi:hypothetical protein
MAGADRNGLEVQWLGDEALVYDTTTDEAHLLQGAAALEFETADDDVSRRQVLRSAAFAGAALTSGGLLVKTIVAPRPAQAQSTIPCGLQGETCSTATQQCCPGVGTSGSSSIPFCCPLAQECCGNNCVASGTCPD